MGLHIPRLARRGVAVVRLRGLLGEAGTGRLTSVLRQVFTTDPQLVIIDLGGLRGWDESGQRQPRPPPHALPGGADRGRR